MKTKLFTSLLASTALGAVLIAAPASAQSTQDLLKELNALKTKVADLEKKVEESETKDIGKSDDGFSVKWEPAPSIKSDDGRFEMNLRGRIYTDAAWISDDISGIDTKATEFRAARLGVEGHAWNNVKYKFEIDFAGNEVDIKDAYMQPQFGKLKVTLGQFKTPNSLEEQTSSRYTTFMERAAFTDAFGLAREIGAGVGTGGDNWTFNVGAFRGTAGTDDIDEGTTLAARATVSPKIGNGNTQVHFGAHMRYRMIGTDQSLLRYRQRPFAHLSPNRFVNTGKLFDEDFLFGVEGAVVAGPFAFQSEYVWNRSQVPGESDKATFSGGYFEASYYITGESRKYDPKKGSFGRPKVNNPVFQGGAGAWQVAYRYDMVDLTDMINLNGGGTMDIYGGKQKTHIIGVNWWLNQYMRMMFDYSHSKITDAFDVIDSGVNAVDTFSIRAQVDW